MGERYAGAYLRFEQCNSCRRQKTSRCPPTVNSTWQGLRSRCDHACGPKLVSFFPGIDSFHSGACGVLGPDSLQRFEPKHQAAAVAFAADLSDQAAEFPDPVSTDSGRSATVQGGTLREGFWGANTTGGSHLRIPGHDNIGGGGQAGFVPPRPGPAAPARSSTRVMTSWFPAPGSGSPCCSLRVIGGSCAGTELSMDFSEVTIGREQDMNTFALPDPGISSHTRHCAGTPV